VSPHCSTITPALIFDQTTLAFAIEHDVLQECIGVVIVPVTEEPRVGLAELHDLLRFIYSFNSAVAHHDLTWI
jgi:hypothetical protein